MSVELEWQGARLPDPWQGIRYLELGPSDPPVPGALRLTVHMARPVELALAATHVRVRGPEPINYTIEFPVDGMGDRIAEIHVEFAAAGGHGTWTLELERPEGVLLHPFFSTASFVFAIECEAGDCQPATDEAPREPDPDPELDLRHKDFRGLLALLADRVRIANPQWADLAPASFERVLLELLAHHGDMLSYYQDRVANEAFLDTATQRYSLAQHALLLGERLSEHQAATTLLAFDGMSETGEVPAGLQVRMPRRSNEAAVVFTVLADAPVDPANDADNLLPAQWPDAFTATIPDGAQSVLLLGECESLVVGRSIALVQGSTTQVRTIAQLESLEQPGWVADPNDPLDVTPVALTRVELDRPLDEALSLWSDDEDQRLRVHGNLVAAAHGLRVKAVLPSSSSGPLAREDVELRLNRRDSVIVRDSRAGSPRWQLRSLRLPSGPLLWDRDAEGEPIPALELEVDGERWYAQEHLHRSRPYDNHYTVSSEEDGRAWLHFGDDRRGRGIEVEPDPELGLAAPVPTLELVIRYRVGEPTAGNVALGKLSEIVRPRSDESDLLDALAALGDVRVTNVLPATGGARQLGRAAVREALPASLRGGPLLRAVTLDDYARVAEQADERVERAAARLLGGVFNTVIVLVDERDAEQLSDDLRGTVDEALQQLRMTGREVVVRGPDYVPLDVELALCAQLGTPRHRLRERVYAALRPGSSEAPGYFHPDRLSFGQDLELGDLLAHVQGLSGVRSVKALVFRPLRDPSDQQVFERIRLGPTEVARLDADALQPEHGRLRVKIIGLDADIDTSAWSIDQPELGGE